MSRFADSDELEDFPESDYLHEDFDEEEDDDGPACLGCGCTDHAPCPGGCIWATADLCSRCA